MFFPGMVFPCCYDQENSQRKRVQRDKRESVRLREAREWKEIVIMQLDGKRTIRGN